jgi:mannose-6-phosphate isomerase-like protein (cupin superfamily)
VRRGAWQIAAGEATRLQAVRPSVLRVRQGRLWITLDATARQPSEDLVVGPGESLAVPAGQQLVMEPWDRFGSTYTWDSAD